MDSNTNVNSFIPNEEQLNCINKINIFIKDHAPFSKVLINGSAGTGKTTIIISTIVNILVNQILLKIEEISALISTTANESIYKKPNWTQIPLNNFIISAPTNKAKDVLVTKYNIYIEEQLANVLQNIDLYNSDFVKSLRNININISIIIQILTSKISYLTVSQVLSISRVINEMGIEEFTKGNDKKICDKYNKGLHLNTSIIVDECSMIDKNTARLLELIKCPIIYIGDYCQLPPVNEELSVIFAIHGESNNCITLKLVERCKNDITIIANELRNKIYNIIPQFNLLKHISVNLIIYNKTFSKWLESYVNDIKEKQKQICLLDTPISTPNSTHISTPNSTPNNGKSKYIYDTMALGWTNKCCLYLNKKIRSLLFDKIKNIDDYYIIKGDKLLVKTPYYKYDNHIYSSNIVYVSKVENKTYTPLNFKDWCSVVIKINDLQQEKLAVKLKISNKSTKSNSTNSSNTLTSLESLLDINIDDILDTNTKPSTKPSNKTSTKNTIKLITKPKASANILDYFTKSTDTIINNDISNLSELDKSILEKQKLLDIENEELQSYRTLFYVKHILNDIINEDTYIFNDEISMKYNNIVKTCDLHNIKNLPSISLRTNAYTKWHCAMSAKLFGIPNNNISCKKCAFFVKKFGDKLKCDSTHSSYIADFIRATDNLEFKMQLCDLTTFTVNGKCISNNIPIIDNSKKSNSENLDIIRNIIKNSYEVKLMLSKQDELELNIINKVLGEEGESNEKNTKYITMSQMFGHYMSHVITSSYLEVDYGYALTVHKSQGSTYDNVYLEYSNILLNSKENEKNKLLYTSVTRGANKLHIYN